MIKKPKNKFYVEVGFRLRQVRSLNKITQQTLGERLGVALTTVQRYETGEIHIPSEAIYKSAKMLNTSVSFLYGEEGQTHAPSNINRTGLLVAAEIMELPNDTIRKNIYHLVRSINKAEAEQEIKRKSA